MAKALFRFLRGELNGFYLQSINTMMNNLSVEQRRFFFDFYRMQFEQGRISNETLANLGRFAGIYLPRIPQEEARSATRMTESEYDEQLDYEFSERGLFKTQDEDFEFVQKVVDDTGLPDINTLATEEKRSTLVGTETPLGYISEDTEDVLDDSGNVVPEAILPAPPSGKAYSEFYGNKFLFLSEGETVMLPVSYDVFLPLFKAIQYARYNGSTLSALTKIIEVLCPYGLVKINSIYVANTNNFIYVSYTTDLTVDIDLKQDRINMLLYVIRIKFPQIQMTESL